MTPTVNVTQWRSEANPAPPAVRYEFIVCPMCRGSGLYCWEFHGSEVQEPCRPCNGRGAYTVERYE